jgi:hypothetical protein
VGVCTPVNQTYSTHFRIVFSVAQSLVSLSDGVSVPNVHVAANKTVNFMYSAVSNTNDITVTITTLTGDPDLVGSFIYAYPSCIFTPSGYEVCSNFTYLQNQAGDETLVVPASSIPTSLPARLYLGVFGFTDSTFSIVVTQNNGSVADRVYLLDGMPQAGRVQPQTVCATRNGAQQCLPGTGHAAYGNWYSFILPATSLALHGGRAFLMLNKFCNTISNVFCNPPALSVGAGMHGARGTGRGWRDKP